MNFYDDIDEGCWYFIVFGVLFVVFSFVFVLCVVVQLVIVDEGVVVYVVKVMQVFVGSLKINLLFDVWVKIIFDGKVIVFIGKVEFGIGVCIVLLQVVVEEFDMKLLLIMFLIVDIGVLLDEGLIVGSYMMVDSGFVLLNVIVQVCVLLVEGVVKCFGVDLCVLMIVDVVIKVFDGCMLIYGDVICMVDLYCNVVFMLLLKNLVMFVVIGMLLLCVDILNKVMGGVSYVQDMQLFGMLYVCVVMLLVYDVMLLLFDEVVILKLFGVVWIVCNGSMFVVVVQGEWQVVVVQCVFVVGCCWLLGCKLFECGIVYVDLKWILMQCIEIVNMYVVIVLVVKMLNVMFLKNYLLYGLIGLLCLVVYFENGMMMVWIYLQGVYLLCDVFVEMLLMLKVSVCCIYIEGFGCYGYNVVDDVVVYVVLIVVVMLGKLICV